MFKTEVNILVLFFNVLLVCSTKADFPFWHEDVENEFSTFSTEITRNSQEVYRLPENVIPIEYNVYIDLYFAEKVENPFSFDGRVEVIIQPVEENVTQVVLHANVDKVRAISLLQNDVPEPLNLANQGFYEEPQYHFLKIDVLNPLKVGTNYTLIVTYSNTMNDGPLKRGIWKGWYRDADGNERIYAATHFQPYNARQAFPCWDEPLFKSVFTLHLSHPTTHLGVFSNTPIRTHTLLADGRVQDNFFPTPKMSSYLVTFLISESFQVIAQNTTFTPPIRIIGRSNTAGLGQHALDLAVKLTEHFDEYFNFPYADMHPYLMNDHISSPDWASAGTENWGMVSYRELYLIIDSEETIMSVEHYATTLVAHELAHKWFGNLITCFWWSNTWINEGFASYFGYIAGDAMFPKYELPEHFNARYLQNSLSYDSGVNTEAMNHEVNTPAQVTGHFGTISYSKGAAFLRMTVNIISEPTFRKACEYFLKNNTFQATDQYDLYNSFAHAIAEDNSIADYQYFNFTEYYRVWVNEPGYPILNVDVNHETGEMFLSQERFFLSPTAGNDSRIYPIPITYSTKSNPQFRNLKPINIMSGQTAVFEKDPVEEWVIFNNLQHGHYRVNYDDTTWDLIAEALEEDPDSIDYLNRAQIVDDVYALMRSSRMTYRRGFYLLRFLKNETNYHVWNSAITMYTWIRNRFRHIPQRQIEFDEVILNNLAKVLDAAGYEPTPLETPTHSMLRQDILHFACMLNHAGCIEASRNRFLRWRDDGEKVPAVIHRNVYVVGIRHGNTEDFDFLLQQLNETNFANNQLEMLRALAATNNPELLNRYLHLTLTQTVRYHDKTNAFNYALLGNNENAITVLQFVKDNIDAIRVAYVEDAPNNPVHTVMSNLAAYLNEAGLNEYQEWLVSTQTNTLQYNNAISAINSARNNIIWGNNNVDEIISAAESAMTGSGAGSAAGIAVSAALLVIATMYTIVLS